MTKSANHEHHLAPHHDRIPSIKPSRVWDMSEVVINEVASLSSPNTPFTITSITVSPPPPAVQDDETAQLVDAALARRHSKGFRHSLQHSPLSPYFKKRQSEGKSSTIADEGEGAEARSSSSSAPPEGAGAADQPVLSRGQRRPAPERLETFGTVKLEDVSHKDPSTARTTASQKVLYRYADIYENQRGWARFGTLKFSSRALKLFFHYKDPAPFTKYEQTEDGLKEVDLPYTSLDDVQLPSADWTWHSSGWLIDMSGDGATAYDGFQYNTHFRLKGWKPIAPKWHSYFVSCCRRRRWLRLMVYLPSLVSADASGTFHPPSHIPTASEPATPFKFGKSQSSTSVGTPNLPRTPGAPYSPPFSPHSNDDSSPRIPFFETRDVWKGDKKDWPRCHAALKSVKSDGRRLELWRTWIGQIESQESDITGMGRLSLERRRKQQRGVQWTEDQGQNNEFGGHSEPKGVSQFITDEPLTVEDAKAPREYLTKVLHDHAQDILSSFVYPDSRARFHDMLKAANLLDYLPKNLSFSISTDFRERLDL